MKNLMTHIVAGYPDMKTSEELVVSMERSGVGYVEIQIPFSDPVADGPTIMNANQRSLENGTSTEDCFELMERLKTKVNIPLLFMTYYNILFKYGVEAFCKRAKKLGCYGLIVPDIPLDEEGEEHYIQFCRENDLHPIQIVSPLTPDDRLEKIGKVASGFVYCVSRLGTTGVGTGRDLSLLDEKLGEYLENVRKYIKVRLAVGFGISTAEHVKMVSKHADIVVIGSKIIDVMNAADEGQKIVENFLKKMMSE